MPAIGQQTRRHFCGDQAWQLREADEVLADYQWSQIRYLISWKAYCFKDAADHSSWCNISDDLRMPVILDTLEQGPRPGPTEFAILLARTFINFPGTSD